MGELTKGHNFLFQIDKLLNFSAYFKCSINSIKMVSRFISSSSSKYVLYKCF